MGPKFFPNNTMPRVTSGNVTTVVSITNEVTRQANNQRLGSGNVKKYSIKRLNLRSYTMRVAKLYPNDARKNESELPRNRGAINDVGMPSNGSSCPNIRTLTDIRIKPSLAQLVSALVYCQS